MSAYECERHGLQWGIPMCRSVHDALLAGKAPDVAARFDLEAEAYLLCPDCAAKASAVLAAEVGTIDDDALNFWFEGRLLGDCILCLEERLKAVGLRSYMEILDAERARLRTSV